MVQQPMPPELSAAAAPSFGWVPFHLLLHHSHPEIFISPHTGIQRDILEHVDVS